MKAMDSDKDLLVIPVVLDYADGTETIATKRSQLEAYGRDMLGRLSMTAQEENKV